MHSHDWRSMHLHRQLFSGSAGLTSPCSSRQVSLLSNAKNRSVLTCCCRTNQSTNPHHKPATVSRITRTSMLTAPHRTTTNKTDQPTSRQTHTKNSKKHADRIQYTPFKRSLLERKSNWASNPDKTVARKHTSKQIKPSKESKESEARSKDGSTHARKQEKRQQT